MVEYSDNTCDMCFGSGKQITLVHKESGEQVYDTTESRSPEEWEKHAQWELENTVEQEIDCSTCNGTGKLPIYLTPEYWRR